MVYESKDGELYFSPWEYVKDILGDKAESEEVFRRAMGLNLLNFDMFKWGLYRVSDDMARRLEEWSGVESKTWKNIQCSYDKRKNG